MSRDAQQVRVGGEIYLLTRDDILAAALKEAPRRVNAYYVEIEGLRFPPKQLLRNAISGTRAFDTGVAVRALEALGFEVVRMQERGKE